MGGCFLFTLTYFSSSARNCFRAAHFYLFLSIRVKDNRPVLRPDILNRLGRADACTGRMSARAEEMVLRRTGCPGFDASIGGTVNRPAQNMSQKRRIVVNHGGSQMVFHLFEDFQN